MAEEKFAFESNKVSIAFTLSSLLGDCVISKKILNATIELAPDCIVDIICVKEIHKVYAKAFYSDIKNLNLILLRDPNEFYKNNFQKYDLAFYVSGSGMVVVDHFNDQKLLALAPPLFQATVQIKEYYKENVKKIGSAGAVYLRNYALSRILNKNCYDILSCNGALPIRDNKIPIQLLPKYKPEFDALKLNNYITIYSDIERTTTRPKLKTWPMRYLVEYVARMKKLLPTVEIIQCGGERDAEIENVDRHFLGVDLELTKYILANSLLNVGSEGGLVHLATALGTKCLVLFGFTPVSYYGYNQNINLVSGVCSPCINVVENGSGRTCMRGAKEPPCMLSHTPELVCEITCTYLKKFGLEK